MLIRTMFCGSLLAVLAGCAGVAPSTMVAITNGGVIQNSADIVFEFSAGFPSARAEARLNRGEYRAKYDDQKGTYFQGPPACFSTKLLTSGAMKESLVGHVIEAVDCGFYVARNPAVPMSIYTVSGTGASVMVGNSREEVQAVFTAAQQLRSTEAPGQNNATVATNEVITRLIIANPSISPATAGAAGGIASGIVAVLAEAERGRFVPIRKQPDPTVLKHLVVVASSKQ